MYFFKFFAFILLTSFIICNDRIIQLNHFVDNPKNSYLPVLQGDTFTIEAEGNPGTNYEWIIGNFDKIKEKKLIFPLNLNERNSTTFFRAPNSNDSTMKVTGFYHFKFEVSKENEGNEVIEFEYRKKDGSEAIKMPLNIHVHSKKDEL